MRSDSKDWKLVLHKIMDRLICSVFVLACILYMSDKYYQVSTCVRARGHTDVFSAGSEMC